MHIKRSEDVLDVLVKHETFMKHYASNPFRNIDGQENILHFNFFELVSMAREKYVTCHINSI